MARKSWTVVLGSQAGDEGKAKVTDLAAEDADMVVRYQGGPNAGHTVNAGGRTLKFHQTPSGLAHPGIVNIMGPGMVIDPALLKREIEGLAQQGVTVGDNLKISGKANLIMPWHVQLDGADETSRGTGKIGTTRKGIGPTYSDKMGRVGLRMSDLLSKDRLSARLHEVLPHANNLLRVYGLSEMQHEQVLESYFQHGLWLSGHITNTDSLLAAARMDGRGVLFEGAQGTYLDVDHGTYPYVTSSNPTAGGVCTGAGVGPNCIDVVLGVSKSFFTRVGEGPFPTEQHGEVAAQLAQLDTPWAEKGTTTGRLRRCGWLDLVLLRYSARVNGLDYLAVTKLDTLDQFDEIPLCFAYRVRSTGEIITDIDDISAATLDDMEPIYRHVPGWKTSTFGCPEYDQLPDAAREYLNVIAQETGVELALIGVGPARDHTIKLVNPMRLGRRTLLNR